MGQLPVSVIPCHSPCTPQMFAGSWTTFSLPKESPISASRTLAVGVLAAVAASVEDPTEEITEPATSAAAPTPATVLLGPGQRFSDSAAILQLGAKRRRGALALGVRAGSGQRGGSWPPEPSLQKTAHRKSGTRTRSKPRRTSRHLLAASRKSDCSPPEKTNG